jgi:hypothetical protein
MDSILTLEKLAFQIDILGAKLSMRTRLNGPPRRPRSLIGQTVPAPGCLDSAPHEVRAMLAQFLIRAAIVAQSGPRIRRAEAFMITLFHHAKSRSTRFIFLLEELAVRYEIKRVTTRTARWHWKSR